MAGRHVSLEGYPQICDGPHNLSEQYNLSEQWKSKQHFAFILKRLRGSSILRTIQSTAKAKAQRKKEVKTTLQPNHNVH